MWCSDKNVAVPTWSSMKVKSNLQTPRFDPVDNEHLVVLNLVTLLKIMRRQFQMKGGWDASTHTSSGISLAQERGGCPMWTLSTPSFHQPKQQRNVYYCCVTRLMCLYKYLVLFLLLIEGNVPVHVQHKNIQGNGSLLITFHYALKNVNNVILTILIREHWDLARTTARTNSTTWTLAFELILYVDFSGWIIHRPFSAVFCN